MASGSWKPTPLGVQLSKNSASCHMADKLFHDLVTLFVVVNPIGVVPLSFRLRPILTSCAGPIGLPLPDLRYPGVAIARRRMPAQPGGEPNWKSLSED